MRYVCYNFFLLNLQIEIGNYDLYLYAIVSQIFLVVVNVNFLD
jgi:hypothetical protein